MEFIVKSSFKFGFFVVDFFFWLLRIFCFWSWVCLGGLGEKLELVLLFVDGLVDSIDVLCVMFFGLFVVKFESWFVVVLIGDVLFCVNKFLF